MRGLYSRISAVYPGCKAKAEVLNLDPWQSSSAETESHCMRSLQSVLEGFPAGMPVLLAGLNLLEDWDYTKIQERSCAHSIPRDLWHTNDLVCQTCKINYSESAAARPSDYILRTSLRQNLCACMCTRVVSQQAASSALLNASRGLRSTFVLADKISLSSGRLCPPEFTMRSAGRILCAPSMQPLYRAGRLLLNPEDSEPNLRQQNILEHAITAQ